MMKLKDIVDIGTTAGTIILYYNTDSGETTYIVFSKEVFYEAINNEARNGTEASWEKGILIIDETAEKVFSEKLYFMLINAEDDRAYDIILDHYVEDCGEWED